MSTCEHLPCIIPVSLHGKVTTVETSSVDAFGRSRRTVKVSYQGRYIGALIDDGYQVHPSLGGGWRTVWAIHAGGNAVHVPAGATKDEALEILLRHVEHFSFHWRMALHG